MNLVEYAEKTSPIPLTEWQKWFLSVYEKASEKGEVVCVMPPRMGRRMIMQLIQEFEKNK